MKMFKWSIALFVCVMFQQIQAIDVMVEVAGGYEVFMEMEPDETLLNLQEQIALELNLPIDEQTVIVKGSAYTLEEGVWYDQGYEITEARRGNSRKATSEPRNYQAKLAPKEKKDISFIVTSLASKSYASLLMLKPSLDAAGERINHVHPLRFLMAIFTDEELKVGIRKIHSNGGMIWGDFSGGLKESLAEEAQRGNLTDACVKDFAKQIGIDSAIIFPAIRNQKWNDFIVTLIKKVPRKGDSDRYDM